MIFSHVLYQLSYPGIAMALGLAGPVRHEARDRPAMGSAPMANAFALGKPLIANLLFAGFLIARRRWPRQRVAAIKPADEVAIAAAG